ncbi:hypothetical protein LDG_5028 [Legionella drancourtii LLAP12]|uniref:Uncharacterized protein n=1 Tax=Legionella drancourtii LLAP12 TaxID=658187 RepID=G9EIM2_9GAMM|nr:hypothetical protein LDG_5028 [Legionella drancourtii LLAP12]
MKTSYENDNIELTYICEKINHIDKINNINLNFNIIKK